MTEERLTGEDRCWPCTVANTVVGLVVAWLPLAAALVRGRTPLVVLTLVWGVAVTGYTGYRLVALGYLPYAESVAKWTGLHERIGPAARSHDNPAEEER